MSKDLYYSYYPKVCNDEKIIPFLMIFEGLYVSGKYVPEDFYSTLDTLSTWDEANQCWIFDDVNKLFEFSKVAPEDMLDYIVDPHKYEPPMPHEDDDIFIIWKC